MTKPDAIFSANTGAQKLIGYEAHIFEDRCEVRLTLNETHMNRAGKLHGGLVSTILDAACGYAASRAFHPKAATLVVTLSLTANYLAPGIGPEIVAIGRVRRAGRSIIFVDGEVLDGDTLIATGTGTFKKVTKR